MTLSYISRERFNDVTQEVSWCVFVNVLQGVHFHLKFLTGIDSSCQNKFLTSLLSLWPMRMLIMSQKMLIMSQKALALERKQRQPERVKVKSTKQQSNKAHRQDLTECNQREANVPQKFIYKSQYLKHSLYAFSKNITDLSGDLKKEGSPTKTMEKKKNLSPRMDLEEFEIFPQICWLRVPTN